MITLNQIAMIYGKKLLFTDVNLLLADQARYALVGANGAGKSTLLRLLTGEETPDEGEVGLPQDANIGWLKQDQFRFEDTPIIDVVIQGKPKLWAALQEKEVLLAASDFDEAAGYRLATLEETINHYQGYSARAFAERLLVGLGIIEYYHDLPLKSLSGGFKLRALMAQTLFAEPDILLLDEPTNHLDIVSIEWLEFYLKTEFQGLLLFISHDVEFINRLCQKIIDIDYGEIRVYSGHYPTFLAEKKAIEEQKLQEQKNIENKIASLQSFVDRFRAKASKARQAQSRVKIIEKMELPDIKTSSRRFPHFHFNVIRPSAKRVVRAHQLGKSFGDKRVFAKYSFEIKRGEKVAILGANGMGKSTLMKILLQKIPFDEGTLEWGQEIYPAYFSQDHHEELTTSQTVLQWLMERVTKQTETQIRKVLGHVLFTQDDVQKDILTLSGGEAARLLLAKVMLLPANVLILDEPTNHLDLEATDMLAKALKNYVGTSIVISHNRHFISAMANRILFLSPQGLIDFSGPFAEFEAKYLLVTANEKMK